MITEKSKFKFRKSDNIGALDAEGDMDCLRDCFFDIGDIDILRDCNRPESIVVGRTGSGKSALLLRFGDEEERVILLQPENLALTYITNSNILLSLQAIGVKLDIFFRLLWRHVFTVEILKRHVNSSGQLSDAEKHNFIEKFKALFSKKHHSKALDYLEKWGSSFWKETDYRIKEVTAKLEEEISNTISTNNPLINFSTTDVTNLSEEEKYEEPIAN